MQVFKTFFLLLNKYKGVAMIYFAVFIAVAVILSGNLASSGDETFEETSISIAIIDRDNQTLGKAMGEYFSDTNEIVDVADDEEAILNELYWKKLDYALVIPEGFEESLTDDSIEDMEFECMKVPGYYDASYFESELNQYTAKLKSLLACGYSIEEAEDTLMDLQDENAKVKMASFVNKNQNDKCTNFFLYVPYLFISIGTVCVGTILLRFNEKEVKDRMECSSTPMRSRIAGLTGGILALGGIMYAVVLGIGVLLSKGSILNDARLPYFLLNLLVMLLFGLSLGFLTGTIAKNSDTVNGIVNIAGLGLSFLGGVFVPQEFFGADVAKIAKFMPTYWYVKNNSAIGKMKAMTDELFKDILLQSALILCFAALLFAITMVVISMKRKRTA